jgi:hypothetical protein
VSSEIKLRKQRKVLASPPTIGLVTDNLRVLIVLFILGREMGSPGLRR